jgi:hypothetical protein
VESNIGVVLKVHYLPSAATVTVFFNIPFNIGLAERGIRFHGLKCLIERRAMASCPSGIHFTGA